MYLLVAQFRLWGGVFKKLPVCNKVDDFLRYCEYDCVVECSVDPIYATEVLAKVLAKNIPVVTMDAETQLLSGTWLSNLGLISEAEGDQPGSLAALSRDVIAMGFKPVVYGNIKGFLNHKPSENDMKFWSKKQGIRLDKVTSFTDGTKIQIEQALVANGMDATIVKSGMVGAECDDLDQGVGLIVDQHRGSRSISDYVLSSKLPAGVFIAAKHDDNQKKFLKYYKMGNGPYYTFLRPFHLCHLEMAKTVRQIVNERKVLLNNSSKPTVQVYGIAKKDLSIGDTIQQATGSFEVRGEAMLIKTNVDKIPIGLIADATIVKPVSEGSVISFDDVEIPGSLALTAWKDTLKCVL